MPWRRWIEQARDYYGVEPALFLSLYVVKSLIYYYTVYRVVRAIRRRHWDTVPLWILVNVTTNISPWAYVYICGRNLPWWFHWVFLGILIYTALFLGWEIRRRLGGRKPHAQSGSQTLDGPGVASSDTGGNSVPHGHGL